MPEPSTLKIEPTATFSMLLEKLPNDLAGCFDRFVRWRFSEVRDECVKKVDAIKDRYVMTNHLCGEFEKLIIALCEADEWDYAREFLQIYIFFPVPIIDKEKWLDCSVERKLEVRPIVFALRLAKDHKYYPLWNNISKNIFGRLSKYSVIHLYFEIPEVIEYFEKILRDLINRRIDRQPHQRKEGYSEIDWVPTERALKIITRLGSYNFLPFIDELIDLFGRKLLYPDYDMGVFAKVTHLAILKETQIILRRVKKQVEK